MKENTHCHRHTREIVCHPKRVCAQSCVYVRATHARLGWSSNPPRLRNAPRVPLSFRTDGRHRGNAGPHSPTNTFGRMDSHGNASKETARNARIRSATLRISSSEAPQELPQTNRMFSTEKPQTLMHHVRDNCPTEQPKVARTMIKHSAELEEVSWNWLGLFQVHSSKR